MQSVLVSTFVALGVAYLLTPLIRRFALKLNAVASPNHRTIHMSKIPKLGGLGIFAAFFAGFAILTQFSAQGDYAYGLLIGGVILVVLGFFDDLYVLSCYKKLAGQALAASIAIYFGFSIQSISLPFGNTVELGVLSLPLSLLWIIGIGNAINLIDGLDGLAAGVTIIIAMFIAVSAGLAANVYLAALALVLVGATSGFLKYNLPPARIFMGDTGSQFLGFCLACLSIKAFTVDSTGTHLAALILPFAVPLTDTVIAIGRRLREGQHPFWADRKHIHHRLIETRFTQTFAILALYAFTALFALLGLATMYIDAYQATLMMTVFLAVFIFCLHHLGCFEFLQSNRNGRRPGGLPEQSQDDIADFKKADLDSVEHEV
jgi:UDP-GlcNAc:undecaprenyl-phosphate GlcNAc-1-phosphate transferase